MWRLRAFLTLGGIAILQWLARQDIGWKKLAIAQVTLGLILAPYAGRSDIVICLVPMLLILSDWHSARGPGWIAIAAWASPFACALVWIVTDWDWLFLPVVWGNIVQWLMVTAAGWTVWQSLKMRQHATS